ncbi:MAG: KR domain-containing protein, partial [Longimicrobiales bacterium]
VAEGVKDETEVVAYHGGQRHVRGFEPVRLSETTAWSLSGDKKYVVTGGLGGLGLALAEELSQAVAGISLVLIGRTPMPPRWEWPELIESGKSPLVGRLLAVQRMEERGATVELIAADLAREEAIREAMAGVGSVHGVFHAAGALEDAPILAKGDAEWAEVLGPKVRGTDALWSVLAGQPLDFMVCFSSRSSVTGLPGQVDYAAANSFLDGFAARWDRPDRRILAVGWDAWSEVGMAYRLFGAGETEDDSGFDDWTALDHPIFQRQAVGDDRLVLSAVMGRDPDQWMLEDHRIKGGPRLIPGSGYVEIARAAAALHLGIESVELSELMFLEPFVVLDGTERELIVEVSPAASGQGIEIEIRGRSLDPASQETVHVRGSARGAELEAQKRLKLKALKKRCRRGRRDVGRSNLHPHLDFGPRWANLVEVLRGVDEAFATVELPPRFHSDLSDFPLHPGLLDMATAAGLDALPGFDPEGDFYVPTSYGAIRVGGGFQSTSHSHVQVREGSGNGVAIFDIRIYGDDGTPLIEIDEFVMMRIESFNLDTASATEVIEEAEASVDWRRYAIPTSLGMEALRRIMAHSPSARVLVTPRPVDQLLAEAHELSQAMVSQRRRPPPRIDSAAIEAELERHSAVSEAAATAAWVGPDEYRVVAFLVFSANEHATVSELRRHLKAALPPELIPNSYIETTDLPRLADGRVDRKSLPNPFDDVGEYVPPRTDTEKAIARIWEDLLGVERVSLHDNFLDVGGHSLIGIRTLLRIEKETGYRLHPNALTLQTLEQLAAECDEGQTDAAAGAEEPEGLAGRLMGAVRHSVGGRS